MCCQVVSSDHGLTLRDFWNSLVYKVRISVCKVFLITPAGDVHTSFIKGNAKISLWVFLTFQEKETWRGFCAKYATVIQMSVK